MTEKFIADEMKSHFTYFIYINRFSTANRPAIWKRTYVIHFFFLFIYLLLSVFSVWCGCFGFSYYNTYISLASLFFRIKRERDGERKKKSHFGNIFYLVHGNGMNTICIHWILINHLWMYMCQVMLTLFQIQIYNNNNSE